MEDLHKFVEKVHDQQEKESRNKKRHGHGNPASKLPTKQHGTQK